MAFSFAVAAFGMAFGLAMTFAVNIVLRMSLALAVGITGFAVLFVGLAADLVVGVTLSLAVRLILVVAFGEALATVVLVLAAAGVSVLVLSGIARSKDQILSLESSLRSLRWGRRPLCKSHPAEHEAQEGNRGQQDHYALHLDYFLSSLWFRKGAPEIEGAYSLVRLISLH